MKPLLHPSSCFIILFFSVSLLILSINLPTCLCEDGNQDTDCNTAFSCEGSSISDDLKYPFWGGNRDKHCAGVPDPNLELKCEGSVPIITINQVKYRVLDWNNTTQRLKVARDDYGGGNICDVSDYKNSTFENSPFQRDGDQILNLTLLYNCDANPTTMLYRMTCGGGTTAIVYTVVDPSSVYCSPTVIVVIPLLGQQAASLVTGSGINDALKEGFELKWTGDNRKCQTCVDSGGACGNDGENGFICFCKAGSHTTTCNSEKASSSSQKRNRLLIVIGALVGGSGVMIFFIIMISCHLKRERGGENRIIRKQRKFVDHNVKAFMQSYHSLVPKQYNYAELKRITKSFQSKLGQGGYGVVYKASLPDGRHVAVKVISESKGNGEEFINEVASISRTSHVNIVSLMGFCYQANKRALVYEFMPNGSLDKFIYRSDFPCAICDFDWNTLFRIVLGIARGLEYLHQGCISRILHLDIKPQNILLDEDFCPKISDFGLAKICQKKESIVSIPGTRGTIGYMAPEVFSRAFGGISHKSDVYSYGMLILEIIGGRKNHDTRGSHTSEMYFPDWVYKDLEQGNSLINWLAISEEENDMVKKITMVSLWCIQTNPSNRPSMKRVIEMLEGPLQLVPYPPKPVLYSPERPPLQISYMSSSNLYQTNSISLEKNGSIEPNEFNKDESEM